jgi:hypothetical protein
LAYQSQDNDDDDESISIVTPRRYGHGAYAFEASPCPEMREEWEPVEYDHVPIQLWLWK